MRCVGIRALASCLSIAAVASAGAQSSPTVQWWGGGGYGSFGCWENFRCDARVFGESREVFSGYAGAGITPSAAPALVAGVEVSTRAKRQAEILVEMRTLAAVLMLRRAGRSGPWLRGSFGLAFHDERGTMDDMVLYAERTGRVISAGAGLDVRLYSKLFISPGVEVGGTNLGAERWSKMWEYRIGLSWH